jgi:MarR family transcriptional regulator, lower aerobic nicotinate degradation pathway regulator
VELVPKRLSSKATYLTTQLAGHAQRLASEAFARAGARSYHYRVLAALAEIGPASQADLGRRVHMDRSDVVAAVTELASLGHLRREPDQADRRRNIVHLTDAGRRQLRRLDQELDRAQEIFLGPLAADDRTRYHAMLTTLLAHHGSAARAESPSRDGG